MATSTMHITFPTEWVKEIKSKIKKDHYTVSEYFKELYRKAREEEQLEKAIALYENEKAAGTLKKLTSIDELFE